MEPAPEKPGRCLAAKPEGTVQTFGELLKLFPEEPFRLFFPLGIAVSIHAALLWVFFHAGWLGNIYPGIAHSRLMMEGFVAAFAIGFLGTAGPRFLGAPRLHPAELGLIGGLYLGTVLAHSVFAPRTGDTFFAAFLIAFTSAMTVRFFRRTAAPPPGFVLAAAGLFCALAGAILLATEAHAPMTAFRFRLARLLLHEGFILLPILGIGGFLFPRFTGSPVRPAAKNLLLALGTSLAILAALILDATGQPVAGGILRATAAGAYLVATVPNLFGRGGGTLVLGLRVALGSILAGLVVAAFFPAQRVGLDHFVFVSGYGLLILVTGGRVAFGHAGHLAGIAGKSIAFRWIIGLVVVAASTRAVADFIPAIRPSHLIYAGLLWTSLTVVWLRLCLPMLRVAERDDS